MSRYIVKNDEQILSLEGCTATPEGNFIDTFSSNARIDIIHLDEESAVFDLVGVDVSIANALRRILLAEVPTMAIETVYIQENTSIIQDEVLSHRLGLVPIRADPRLFDDFSAEDEATDLNTLVFKLDVSCGSGSVGTPGGDWKVGEDGSRSYNVLSGQLEWQPQGEQAEKFAEDPIRSVHPDIPLVVMKAGQTVRLEAHCHKGIGKDHTKYSPCATASYRLMPDISFNGPVEGTLAQELVEMCPMQVFDIEDLGKSKSKTKLPTAVVARPRDCTMCRECIRREGWDQRVNLKRVANHFIFTVESSGCVAPRDIIKMAIQVLRDKATKLQKLMTDLAQEDS